MMVSSLSKADLKAQVNSNVLTYMHAAYMHCYIHAHMFVDTAMHLLAYIHTCTHTHACMHACMHAYIHTYIHTFIHTYIHTYIQTYTHMLACRQRYIHTHACMQAEMHTHACMQTDIGAYVQHHPFVHIHVLYTCTYMYLQSCNLFPKHERALSVVKLVGSGAQAWTAVSP